MQAAGVDLNALLKGIEQRYNHAKTLQVQFSEAYSVGGQARKSEAGVLTLRKPGRMRWDYTAPPGKLFLSDGKEVYLYTPESHRVEKTPLKETEDIAKEFREFAVKPDGANYIVTAKAKTNKLPYERVEMTVTPDYQIQRLVINGQDQSILSFRFAEEKLNPAVEESQFKFQMPPGATLVSGEVSQ
jgi:outer membrane lipoprotein carrier protein